MKNRKSYLTKDHIKALKSFLSTEEGRARLVEMQKKAHEEGEEFRSMTKIDRALLREPFTI